MPPLPPHWPTAHATIAMGIIVTVYGILANIYSGRIQKDGQRYEPSRNLRVYTIVVGVLLFLIGFVWNRYWGR
jgi:hypothetical protein